MEKDLRFIGKENKLKEIDKLIEDNDEFIRSL